MIKALYIGYFIKRSENSMKTRNAKQDKAPVVLASEAMKRSKNIFQHFGLYALVVLLIVVSATFANADTKKSNLAQGKPSILKQAQGATSNPAILQTCPRPVLNLKVYLDRSFNAFNDQWAIKNAAKKVIDMFSKRYGALEQPGVVNVQVLAYASYGQWQTPSTDTQIDIVNPAFRDHQKQVIDSIFYTNNVQDAYVLNSRYNYVANQNGMDFNSPDIGAGPKPWFGRVFNDPGLNNISGVMVGLGQYNHVVNQIDRNLVANMGVFVTRGAFSGNTGPSYTADELGPLVPGGPEPTDDQLVDNDLANYKGVEYGGDVVNAIRTGAPLFGGWGPAFGNRPDTNVVGILAGGTVNDPNIQNNMNYVFGNRDPVGGNSGWFDENQIDNYFNDRIFNQLESKGCTSQKTKYYPGLTLSVGTPDKSELWEASGQFATFPVTVTNVGNITLTIIETGGMTCKPTVLGPGDSMKCTAIKTAPPIGQSTNNTIYVSAVGVAKITNPQTEALLPGQPGWMGLDSPTQARVEAFGSGSLIIRLLKLPV